MKKLRIVMTLMSSVFVFCLGSFGQTTVIEEESTNCDGHRYRLVRYSDGNSRIYDETNNWIDFFTEYKKNEFTGESTIPYDIGSFLPNCEGFQYWPDIFAASINTSNEYGLQMENGRIILSTPLGYSYCINHFFIKHEPDPFKDKKGDDYFREWDFMNEYKINRNGYIPRIILTCFIQKDVLSHIDELTLDAQKALGTNYYLIGSNGNKLEEKRYDFKGGIGGMWGFKGWYDDSTQKVYFIYKLAKEGLPLPEDFVLQVYSGNGKEELVYCLPTDTIERIVSNENVEETYFTNGDYLKYSKLKRGVVYDCSIHRSNGIWTVNYDGENLRSQFEFTTGEWSGLVYTGKIRYSDYGLCLVRENLVDVEVGDSLFNPKTKKYQLLLNNGEFFYGSKREYDAQQLAKKQADERAQDQARLTEKQKERQSLYQKYGKQYVDALFDEGKILVGTPEGLVKNHTQSTLINETQYTRTYKIKGWLNDWGATVDVNTKTGKVTAVRNRTL